VNEEQVHELLYQALQTEMGSVEVYRTAVNCAVNEELKEEEEYLEQTEKHVQTLRDAFDRSALTLRRRHRAEDRPAYLRIPRQGDGNGA
jgi:FtsZ-binding cell division protein ZapB